MSGNDVICRLDPPVVVLGMEISGFPHPSLFLLFPPLANTAFIAVGGTTAFSGSLYGFREPWERKVLP